MSDQETFRNLGITAMLFLGLTLALIIIANVIA